MAQSLKSFLWRFECKKVYLYGYTLKNVTVTKYGSVRGDYKYHAKKVAVDGITFDSKKEANYYCELKMLKMGGVVKDFDMQVPFELQPKFKRGNKTERAIKYIADFFVTIKMAIPKWSTQKVLKLMCI